LLPESSPELLPESLPEEMRSYGEHKVMLKFQMHMSSNMF
jgi:hypothetical protein